MKTLNNGMKLKETLTSGQCFRIIEEDDGSFTCILDDRVINIYEKGEYLYFTSNNEENLEQKIRYYFDLDTNYYDYYGKLNDDPYMKEVTINCRGYRLLRQNTFEMYISYIISQNNAVRNITNSINLLSKMYGEEVFFNGKTYYLFPTFNGLKDITSEELRECKVGFRDKYIIAALDKIKEDNNYLNYIDTLSTEDALTSLCSIKGIGLKVASCILLFGYYRLDTFPIDTWVIKTISENYRDIKPNQKEISKFTKEKFGKLSGIAIQFMFHSERNLNEKK